MSTLSEGNLLVAHGGGPTAVINASLQGVVEEAKKYSCVKNIIGARFGLEGILKEDFVDLGKEPESKIARLQFTPASALGSCRKRLIEEEFLQVLRIFKSNNVRYFFYNGGNDSIDTCNKISMLSREYDYDLKVIGIPKTVDNDLCHTDHCPGYGSAARFTSVSVMEQSKDLESLPINVRIIEIMGRNAGWLTAASVLGKQSWEQGPHLVYLPEIIFNEEKFLEDVKKLHKEVKGVIVAVSEGIKDESGKPVLEGGIADDFGHKMLGGVSQYLSNLVVKKLGISSRYEVPGLLGRASIPLQSTIDREEAKGAGAYAVQTAIQGKSGYMVSLVRVSNRPYRYDYGLVPLEQVANLERKFPLEWINKEGNGIEKTFVDYCMPLIGELLPEYVSLDMVPFKWVASREGQKS